MKFINIPFNAWSKDKLNKVIKCATSRTKQYGEKGNYFMVDGRTYQIEFIVELPLWFVKHFLYETEGCETPDEFEVVWCKIHPVKGFDSSQIVYYHFFNDVTAFI